MCTYMPITDVYAREILDSRGNPAVEVEVMTEDGTVGRASVPSGASTGIYEAVELRDHEARYQGKGVQKACHNVNTVLADAVIGENVYEQTILDRILIQEDGTENKEKLGANAILGVSMAVADAAAKSLELPLFRYLGGKQAYRMPVPMMNILNGGVHADNTVDLQEFMIMPVGADSFGSGLQICADIYHTLREDLKKQGLSTGVGDEGGFAPDLEDTRAVLEQICSSVQRAGYQMGRDIRIALDAAASELFQEEEKVYYFPGESRMKGKKICRDTDEMIAYLDALSREYAIASIEDGLDQKDWEGWARMTQQMGERIQLVGDDLFVTNTGRLEEGIRRKAGNAILIKVNQIGTLTEAFAAIALAKEHGYRSVISHRSGETENTMIADIAVAMNTGQIKTGAPCRGERVAKYNQLLRIEDQMGFSARYINPFL